MAKITTIDPKDYEAIAQELYDNIRLADQLEMRELGEDCPGYIIDSMEVSDILYQARTNDGKLLCVMGTSPSPKLPEGYHVVWCLGTKELSRHKREFVVQGHAVLKEFLFRKGTLFNIISVNNTEAITWIKHQGAHFYGEVKVRKGIFKPFFIERSDFECAESQKSLWASAQD